MPVAGSAYTFSYATLGEVVAWIIGWDLILELALGAGDGRVGWSTYFADLVEQAGITLPEWIYSERSQPARGARSCWCSPGCICLGINISARINLVIVTIKLAIVLLVIIAGLFFVKASNYSPFIPPRGAEGRGAAGGPVALAGTRARPGGPFGVAGIFTAAALVFFAFIGFDIVATAAEETEEPAARHAARHPRVAGHLHDAVRRCLPRRHRHGEVRPS